jgi:RNA polymerase sigma-70 factor (ECF subfamily)
MSHEDLVNESVLRAYQSWENIKAKDKLLYYLFGTARNIVLNTVRKKTEYSLEAMKEESVNESTASNSAEMNMEVEFLYEQLDKLSDQKKEALILFEISGFSIKEIAKLQNSTEGAVKVMLSRARKELKVFMEDQPKQKVLMEI